MADPKAYTNDNVHEDRTVDPRPAGDPRTNAESRTTADSRTTGEITMITGGSIAEILVGLGAIALACLGLANVAPVVSLGVCVIAVGCGLIMQGTTIAGSFSTLLRQTSEGEIGKTNFGGGVSKELLAGLAGIGLGISSIVGLIPGVLVPVAAIVLGATFIASSRSISKLNGLMVKYSNATDASKEVAGAAITDASGLEVLVGLAAVTLGIISLVTGIVAAAATIILIAFLVLAIGTFLTGVSLSGRTLSSVSVRI
jgi:hypothetical protein